MADISINDIFEAMPGRFNPEAAGGWNTRIQFHFSGDGNDADWYMTVADSVCAVNEGTVDSPVATIRTSAATWIGMVTGTVNPMNAFMSQQIKVEGNITELMKLQNPKLFRRA